jgi:indolepyruvate ferredoxin oxidoreductase beta subunit
MMSLVKDPLNLIITGVGGQGNVLASQLIGNALVAEGYFVTIGETYGASQRGGPVMSHVRISQKAQPAPLISEGKSDVILGLEPMETIRVMVPYGNPSIQVVTNTRPIYPLDVTVGNAKYPGKEAFRSKIKELSQKAYFVDATEMAIGLGDSILANIIMVGALLGLKVLPIGPKEIKKVLQDTFSSAKVEMNVKALKMGMDAVNGA